MTSEKDFVVRSVRMPLWLDKEIKTIAEYEDRTISKIIQRLLATATLDYREKNREFGAFVTKKIHKATIEEKFKETGEDPNNYEDYFRD